MARLCECLDAEASAFAASWNSSPSRCHHQNSSRCPPAILPSSSISASFLLSLLLQSTNTVPISRFLDFLGVTPCFIKGDLRCRKSSCPVQGHPVAQWKLAVKWDFHVQPKMISMRLIRVLETIPYEGGLEVVQLFNLKCMLI